ncbi:aspartic peptidase A1 [Irpex lacteus]|nr:aspartic peptidase A1 [Irpex lacteus]
MLHSTSLSFVPPLSLTDMLTRLSVTLVLALACAAHPLVNVARGDASPVSLSLAKRMNFTGPTKLIEQDKLRATQLFDTLGLLGPGTMNKEVPLKNTLVSYTVQVGVGSPPTFFELIVDTGSSNTWVGANKHWKPTSTSKEAHKPVAVTYGSGGFSGTLVTDQVTLGNLVIKNQAIGVANNSIGFDGVDGILGIGPTALTQGTTKPSSAEIPTVVDTAARERVIASKYVGIYFQPPTNASEVNGVLTFGHADSSKFTSPLYEIHITSKYPANQYVGIDQSITYGSKGTVILSKTSGIVDTGTTLILLSTSAYNSYVNVTGATFDEDVGLLSIPAEDYKKLESLYFRIGSKTFELTSNAQIWPRSLNAQIGGATDKVYLVISDAGPSAPPGLDFISGQAFLERFYTTYDSQNNKFGIAETAYTRYEGN